MRLITIAILFALSSSTYAQLTKYDMRDVPKNANKILIVNKMSFTENYAFVGRILVQCGYGLKTANKDFGLFETAPKAMNRKQGWTAIFDIVVADSLITITGQFTSGVSISYGSGVRSEASFYEIKYMGKGLFDNSAFFEMMDVGMKFGDNIQCVIN